MTPRNMHVVIHWPQDNKAGIEPLSHVPENSRFVGAVTTAQFSGDKKWYPARIKFISDNKAELEKKADELAQEILADLAKSKMTADGKVGKRNKHIKKSPSKATPQAIAKALGMRVPVQPELQPEKSQATRKHRESEKNYFFGQNELDHQTSTTIARNLFPSSNDSAADQGNKSDEDDLGINDNKSGDDDDCSSDLDVSPKKKKTDSSRSQAWCSCSVCALLLKHCNPGVLSLLCDLSSLFENATTAERNKMLQLLPLGEKVKKAELSIGHNVHVPLFEKDMIKADFNNKPSSLIRETLYLLYGKDAFRKFTVTARGRNFGTYGIDDNVLKALWKFVNRHVETQIKFKELCAIINKRAGEWKKALNAELMSSGSKSEGKARKKKAVREGTVDSLEVTSTSPFKCVPWESRPQERAPLQHGGPGHEQHGEAAAPAAPVQPAAHTAQLGGPPGHEAAAAAAPAAPVQPAPYTEHLGGPPGHEAAAPWQPGPHSPSRNAGPSFHAWGPGPSPQQYPNNGGTAGYQQGYHHGPSGPYYPQPHYNNYHVM